MHVQPVYTSYKRWPCDNSLSLGMYTLEPKYGIGRKEPEKIGTWALIKSRGLWAGNSKVPK